MIAEDLKEQKHHDADCRRTITHKKCFGRRKVLIGLVKMVRDLIGNCHFVIIYKENVGLLLP